MIVPKNSILSMLLLLLGVGSVPLTVRTAHAQRPPTGENQPLFADYRSTHFWLHADLDPKEAQDLLKRLEVMLVRIAKYWGQPPTQVIEAYVAKDLRTWPPPVLATMSQAGIAQIQAGAGLCETTTISRGERFVAKSVVYACAKPGVVQHETVHAYCGQTFGRTGPSWYAEGMAEMGQYWDEGQTAVKLDDAVRDYLRESPLKPLEQTILEFRPMGDSWREYAWRWALCNLLANNPNYASRFRPLGLGLLQGQEIGFDQVYGGEFQQLSFEYAFFIKHVDNGYRLDLCAWDWKKPFKPLTTSSRIIGTVVQADHGWQPTGLTVMADIPYEYSATGDWKLEKTGPKLTADGAEDGSGRLEGVLMRDFQLSRPFELGTFGAFQFKVQGDLYVRCREAWNQLEDNSGRTTFKIKVKGRGSPLRRPE